MVVAVVEEGSDWVDQMKTVEETAWTTPWPISISLSLTPQSDLLKSIGLTNYWIYGNESV